RQHPRPPSEEVEMVVGPWLYHGSSALSTPPQRSWGLSTTKNEKSYAIEIEHGSDRIDAQTIGMIDVQPEQSAAEQKALHFLPSIVKHTGVPIGLDALAWVSVIIEVRAVKEAQPVSVVGKVRRHPIENHTNAVMVAG